MKYKLKVFNDFELFKSYKSAEILKYYLRMLSLPRCIIYN